MACYIITEILDKLRADYQAGKQRNEPDPYYLEAPIFEN
jgi:hypothetical protein